MSRKRSPLLVALVATLTGVASDLASAAQAAELAQTRGGVRRDRDRATPDQYVCRLKHRISGFSLGLSAQVPARPVTFKGLPDFGTREIVHGALSMTNDRKEHIRFAWDQAGGKLHVDLNRNLDLTDDPAGVFESERRGRHQEFSGVPLSITDESVTREYVVDVTMLKYPGRLRGSVYVRSGWEGDIELHGQKWRLSVVDNLDGFFGPGDMLVLRRNGAYSFPDCPAADQFQMPERISFGGHHYGLAVAFERDDAGSQIVATLTETQPRLGIVKIDGRFVRRLTLRNGSRTAILDSPGASVSVPAGSYGPPEVYLDAGPAVGPLRARGSTSLTVRADKPSPLKLGGPLSNTVAVAKRGSMLTLRYKLLGVGDESYEAAKGSRDTPPRFAVQWGGLRIASGSFEYG